MLFIGDDRAKKPLMDNPQEILRYAFFLYKKA